MLVLIIGPSGVGKSAAIRELVRSKDWIPLKSLVTRPPRKDEDSKTTVSDEELRSLARDQRLWSYVQQLGHSYGLLAEDIQRAVEDDSNVYVTDFSWRARLASFSSVRHRAILLLPESLDCLERRLFAAGRGERFATAASELEEIGALIKRRDDAFLDVNIVMTVDGDVAATAERILLACTSSASSD